MKTYGRIVAKAWNDAAFQRWLLADPGSALREEGIPVPQGMEVRIVENTDRLYYLPLPPKPAGLSTEELSEITGGAGWYKCIGLMPEVLFQGGGPH